MNYGKLGSSVNPEQLSLTIKAVLIALLPVLKNLIGIEIVSDQVNTIVDAIFTLAMAGVAIYGYVRSRRD